MFLLFLTWKHDDCFIPQLGHYLQSSKTPDLKPEDEDDIYSDLVYKFKRIVGKPNFSDQFKKIVKRYIRVGYNLDIMRQSACLVVNPITVAMVSSLIARRWVGPQTL